MSRTRTLQMLLVLSATAWVMVLGAIGGMISMHVLDRPHPRALPPARGYYERAVRQPALLPPARVYYEPTYRQPVAVRTPYGMRRCCPPPPCCPRGAVAHVATATPPAPRPPWPFLFVGFLAAGALVTQLVSRRTLVPTQP